MDAIEFKKDQERRADQELIGHRVEEGTEGRGLVQLTRQVAVEPVGDCHGHEQHRSEQVLRGRFDPQVEHADDQGDRNDAGPGEQCRQVEEHAPILAASAGAALIDRGNEV